MASTAAAQEPPSELPATSWLLVEEESGDVLAEHESSLALPVASATKLMTAYLTLRELPARTKLAAPPYEAVPGESLMGLEEGETVKVRELLYGLLLASGNDAAVALAEGVAGSTTEFVERMNVTAERLGLEETEYRDPIGLDAGNISSARDLVALAINLRRNKLFRRIVDTPRITLRVGGESRELVNRNLLVLEEPFVDGIKTGTTLEAGYVLVASASRRGVGFVAAVLGAPDESQRDEAALALLEYGASLYSKQQVVEQGERIASLRLDESRGRLPLVAAGPVEVVVRGDQAVEIDFEPPPAPIEAIVRGEPFGIAKVKIDGRKVAEVGVVAGRDAPAAPSEDDGALVWVWLVLGAGAVVALVALSRAVTLARRASD